MQVCDREHVACGPAAAVAVVAGDGGWRVQRSWRLVPAAASCPAAAPGRWRAAAAGRMATALRGGMHVTMRLGAGWLARALLLGAAGARGRCTHTRTHTWLRRPLRAAAACAFRWRRMLPPRSPCRQQRSQQRCQAPCRASPGLRCIHARRTAGVPEAQWCANAASATSAARCTQRARGADAVFAHGMHADRCSFRALLCWPGGLRSSGGPVNGLVRAI